MSSIDALLAQARSGLERIAPSDLGERMAEGALVIDHRDSEDIAKEGQLPGAIIVRRSLLEWRLAPDSPDRLFHIPPDQVVILVCSDGYSSSLAAATLQRIGIPRATDLIGGYRAWRVLRIGFERIRS
ncbi:MAG: rhodanese-like domain-containing protein [Acidimicrobiales bacterium]|nr:rhodanese-like domain-containing protein [Acidimicrobiales bacterium]